MTNPSNGVIEGLISSGEIGLISNDALKYLLADWKDQIGNLYENEQIAFNFGIRYINSFQGIIPDPRQRWNDWEAEKLERAFDELVLDFKYRSTLVNLEKTNLIVIEECKTVLLSLEKITRLLDQEIKSINNA